MELAVAIRTKGRAPFDYNGRKFVWHVTDEVLLRIASVDKQFSVAYELVGTNRLLAVGHQARQFNAFGTR